MTAGSISSFVQGMVVLLTLTGIVIGALAWTHDRTADRIDAQRNRAFWHLAEELSGDATLHARATRPLPGVPSRLADGRLLSLVRTKGYGGTIELLVLQAADGSIAGIRTVRHAETPGIGDFINAGSAWMRQFDGRSSKALGSVDGHTGATITANAVMRGVGSLSEAQE